jgi:MFS transporter, PAT family, solute carrier family 33 (acetyl-CoA transportor), member 1
MTLKRSSNILQSNLGGSWVKTFFLWLVDIITWKSCLIDDASKVLNSTYLSIDSNKCADKEAIKICVNSGGKCHTDIDGYYIEVIINLVYGIIWYQWAKRTLDFLQELPINNWHVLSKPDDDEIQDQEQENLNSTQNEKN